MHSQNFGLGQGANLKCRLSEGRSHTPIMFHPAAVGVDGRVNLFVGNVSIRVIRMISRRRTDISNTSVSCPTVFVGKTSKTSSVEPEPFSEQMLPSTPSQIAQGGMVPSLWVHKKTVSRRLRCLTDTIGRQGSWRFDRTDCRQSMNLILISLRAVMGFRLEPDEEELVDMVLGEREWGCK